MNTIMKSLLHLRCLFYKKGEIMKNFKLKPLTEQDAIEICTWRYEKEYAIYNFSDYSVVVQNGWELAIKETRENEFVGITSDGELVAYGRITHDSGKSIIGVGVKPIHCGKGQGKDIMKLLIQECMRRYPQSPVTLEVRSFNKRAIKCYLAIGFEIKDQYTKETFSGEEDEFYFMEYNIE